MLRSELSFTEAVQVCVPFVHDIHSRWKVKHSEIAETQKAHSCQKGCGACCHYGLISSSSLEAFFVLTHCLGSGQTLSGLHEASMTYVENFKLACSEWGHLPFAKASRLAFLKKKVPCPLFVSTPLPDQPYSGHCGVYEARPVICGQFHSTEAPKKCEELEPHGTESAVIDLGEVAGHTLREFERAQFGKSALGHLPLIFAALTTEDGLKAFLRRDEPAKPSDADPHAQETLDFFFYAELLGCLGISLGEADFADLERAQAE